jgi:superfamily II DNA or RNA helicase
MLELRTHQQEVVDQLSQGFEDGHRCQLLYAPTGFGKTEVAMSVMQEVSKSYKKTAMVLDRIVLVEQTSLRLGKYKIPHGVMQAQHWRYRPMERIQICSAQTLEKRKIIPDIDLMIIDECHIQRKGTVQLIKDNPQLKVIGLTATPFTKGLGNIYTNIVGASTTGDLIEKGWLTALKVFIAKEIDMTGAKKVAGEWSADEVSTRGMQITGDIVSEWVKKTHEIFGKPRKTIVFCSGVEHGRDLAKEFGQAGYNFISISYKEDDEFKRATIEDFARPDTTIHGLIATDILTRGFDVPDVMIGVSARPFSKSFSSHVQQLGRVMRPHDTKKYGVWLDHSGNYLRFREDWDKLYEDGVTELKESGESAKKEPNEREKKQSKCMACGALWTSATRICAHCGFERPNMREVSKVPGELRELEAANRKLHIDNQDFYSQVLFYAKTRGYKDGWAAHKYKEKFGVWPRGLQEKMQPPSPETMGWIKSRVIAYAKGRAK